MKRILLTLTLLLLGAQASAASMIPVPLGMVAYSALSYAATTVNVSTVAKTLGATGRAQQYLVFFDSNGGAAAGYKFQMTQSAVAPVALTSSSQGHYQAATATSQGWLMSSGTKIHIAGSAATSSVLLDIQEMQ